MPIFAPLTPLTASNQGRWLAGDRWVLPWDVCFLIAFFLSPNGRNSPGIVSHVLFISDNRLQCFDVPAVLLGGGAVLLPR